MKNLTQKKLISIYQKWDKTPGSTHADLMRESIAEFYRINGLTAEAEEQRDIVAWGWMREGVIVDCITLSDHDREPGKYTVPLYTTPPTPPAGVPDGWLPIETAPKDMSARLFLVDGKCVQGFKDAAGNWCSQNDRHAWIVMRNKPTHWMPLPAAPQPAAQT